MKIFISHASEDKEKFVLPLVLELQKHGLPVWYDNFVIQPGDNIATSIFSGVNGANVGILIVTKHFLEKNWTKAELEILTNRAIQDSLTLIPILVDISIEDLQRFSSYLPTKLAINYTSTSEVASKIAIAALKKIPATIEIAGKIVPTKWYCPYCGGEVWGEASQCFSCKKSLLIDNGNISIFTVIRREIGWFGAATVSLAFLIVFYFLSEKVHWAVAWIFLIVGIWQMNRQFGSKKTKKRARLG